MLTRRRVNALCTIMMASKANDAKGPYSHIMDFAFHLQKPTTYRCRRHSLSARADFEISRGTLDAKGVLYCHTPSDLIESIQD